MGTPPYSSAVTKTPEPVQETLRLPFKNWGATMVVSGGSTIYERLKVDDLTYLVNGLGGYPDLEVDDAINNKSNHSEYLNKHVEWGAINVQEQKNYLLFEFRTTNGKKRDWFELSPDGTVVTNNNAHDKSNLGEIMGITIAAAVVPISLSIIIYTLQKMNKILENEVNLLNEEVEQSAFEDEDLGLDVGFRNDLDITATDIKVEDISEIESLSSISVERNVIGVDRGLQQFFNEMHLNNALENEAYNNTAEALENLGPGIFGNDATLAGYNLIKSYADGLGLWRDFEDENSFELFKDVFFNDDGSYSLYRKDTSIPSPCIN